MEDYVRSYRILGIRPGDSWQELRTAYKSAVRKWHPDRFAQNHPERKQAEEQIKEINRAYQELESYYKENGVLPSISETRHEAPPITPPPPEPAVPEATATEFSSAIGAYDRASRLAKPAAKGTAWWLPWVIAAILMFLSYILVTPADKDPGLETPDPPVMRSPDPVDTPSTTTHPESGKYLAVGMTLDQVYALLGTPTRTEKNHETTEWRYGDAIVFFRVGRVTDWIDSPDHRLMAVNPIALPSAEPPKTFQRNSTPEEVRAAQGTPIRETDAMWDYGLSQVFFQHGRVVGWHDSPLHPLKIRRDPQSTDSAPNDAAVPD